MLFMFVDSEMFAGRIDAGNIPGEVTLGSCLIKDLRILDQDSEKSLSEVTGALFLKDGEMAVQTLGKFKEDLGFTPISEIKYSSALDDIKNQSREFAAKMNSMLSAQKAHYEGSYLCLLPDLVLKPNQTALENLVPRVLFGSADNFRAVAHSHLRQRNMGDDTTCLPSLPDLVNLVSLEVRNNNASLIVSGEYVSLTGKTSSTPESPEKSFQFFYPDLSSSLRGSYRPNPNEHRRNLQNWVDRLSLVIYRGSLSSGVLHKYIFPK